MIAHLPILVVLLPLLVAPLCLLVRSSGFAWRLVLLTCLATFGLSLALLGEVLDSGPQHYDLGGWPAPLGISYQVDLLNANLLILLSGIASVLLLYARHQPQPRIAGQPPATALCRLFALPGG